jgi:hypothetical protein
MGTLNGDPCQRNQERMVESCCTCARVSGKICAKCYIIAKRQCFTIEFVVLAQVSNISPTRLSTQRSCDLRPTVLHGKGDRGTEFHSTNVDSIM